MNRIVRENYPVADLPENLREGLPTDGNASVTIQLVAPKPAHVPTLKELLAIRPTVSLDRRHR